MASRPLKTFFLASSGELPSCTVKWKRKDLKLEWKLLAFDYFIFIKFSIYIAVSNGLGIPLVLISDNTRAYTTDTVGTTQQLWNLVIRVWPKLGWWEGNLIMYLSFKNIKYGHLDLTVWVYLVKLVAWHIHYILYIYYTTDKTWSAYVEHTPLTTLTEQLEFQSAKLVTILHQIK